MQNQDSDIFVSPRISALKQEIVSGNMEALNNFWEKITQEGTPLIENLPHDEHHALVTIIWRADEQVDHVVFYSELLRGMSWNNWTDAILHRLLQTNLYFRTYRVRTDMRFVYWISPNHPLIHVKSVLNWDEFIAHCLVDPLNPNKFIQDKDRSFVEMPEAKSQAWHKFRPNAPHGKVECFPWHSESLNNDRKVWMYTPPNYNHSGNPYNLLLLFDGDVYTRDISAQTIFDNLIDDGLVSPFVTVMLDSPNRQQELYCNERFVEFIVSEIIPWVRQNYSISKNPHQTTVAGASAGGLASAYMGFCHPEIFGNVLSNSGAFGWSPEQNRESFWNWEAPPEGEWIIRQFANCEKLPLRFHLDAGLLEDQRDSPIPTILQANRHMRDVLQAKGYWLHYSEFCGGHQYINFRETLAEGLIALLGTAAG